MTDRNNDSTREIDLEQKNKLNEREDSNGTLATRKPHEDNKLRRRLE